ncbi:MAG TPA: hypothetical protein VGJ45_36155 [Pseudonocardiaceae bacterium]
MKLRRFLATSAVAAVAAAGFIGSATGANAAAALTKVWAPLTDPAVHVGVYSQPYDSPTNRVGIPDDTAPGDVYIDCWVSAGQVGNAGDVWYRTWEVYYPNGNTANSGNQPWWTFAPYVDYAYDFHNHVVPQC